MSTGDVHNFMGATPTEARQDGWTSLAAAAVPPEIMEALQAELVLAHRPAPAWATQVPVATAVGTLRTIPPQYTAYEVPDAASKHAEATSMRNSAALRASYAPPWVGQADKLGNAGKQVGGVPLPRALRA